jgi:signal transduction histidine kinase
MGDGLFEIRISDDGKGFSPSAIESKTESPAASSGDGLSNMCRRLAGVGGQCSIQSVPGQGTNIRFVISLNVVSKDL